MSSIDYVTVPQRTSTVAGFHDPPLDGSHTIPQLYDWHYHHNPSHPAFIFGENEDSVQHLTYRDVVQAMHRAGRLVLRAVGAGSEASLENTPVGPIAIAATADHITYLSVVVGMMRAGIVAAPISLSNSETAVAHLLQSVSATHVLVSEDAKTRALVEAAISTLDEGSKGERGVVPKVISMPRFSDIYTDEEVQFLPERKYDYLSPALYLHSSGSSSLPKSITWTHALYMQVGLCARLGPHDLRGAIVGIQGISMAHALGLNTIAWMPCGGFTAGTLPPGRAHATPSPDGLMDAYRATKPHYVVCVPSYLEHWSNNSDDVEFLSSMKGVAYGGGPITEATGNLLVSKGVAVCILYGVTEAGVITNFFPDVFIEDSQYFRLNPHCTAEFVPAGPGIYELFVLDVPLHHIAVKNATIGGKQAYATKDLVEKHPTKQGLWRIRGRADDQIVLSNGEKVNPGPIEDILGKLPSVKAALLFGRSQPQVGVLVFPSVSVGVTDHAAEAEFREKLWEKISQLNETLPKHAVIFKEMILVASQSKPTMLTEKGTIRRAMTLAQYEDEINRLYREDLINADGFASPETWTPASTAEFVRNVVRHFLPSIHSDDQDLLEGGCTSLHAVWISNAILRSVAPSLGSGQRNLVYRWPTIRSLSEHAFQLSSGSSEDIMAGHRDTAAEKMQELVDRLAASIAMPPEPISSSQVAWSSSHSGGKDTVILTGTTGALASAVLQELVLCDQVSRIYTLERPSPDGRSVKARQEDSLKLRNLDTSILSSPKVVSLEADLSVTGFKLPEELYKELSDNVTHILHLAWPVNFNLPLESFEGALKGVCQLINFALPSASTPPRRLIFSSTIGIFQALNVEGSAPEAPITDPGIAQGLGYTESKWVAEQLIARATETAGLRALTVRVGQMSGGRGGCWNTKEWLPALVRTSVTLKKVPRLEGTVNWVPLDVAARALVESRDTSHAIMHLVHPRPVPLSSVMSAFCQCLHLPACDYAEWLSELERRAGDSAHKPDMNALPALKALDFFRSLKEVEQRNTSFGAACCDNSVDASRALREAAQLTEADVREWVEYWKSVEYL